MQKATALPVDDSFHQHATQAVSLMCVVLGIVSVIIPLFYGVNPWTGVVFTVISFWAYWQASREGSYRRAAITIVTILTLSSFAFAIIHGVYGALGFFLILLSGVVASLTLSQKIGVIIFVSELILVFPLAIFQYRERLQYANTPVLPDALMAVLITAVLYVLLSMFSRHLTALKGREHAHLKELEVYNTQMEQVLQNRLHELETQISDRTTRMRHLAQRGKELSHLTHDVSNTLTTLRLVLDQNIQSFSDKDRNQVESSFDYLRAILQSSKLEKQKAEKFSSVQEICNKSLKLMEKSLVREKIQVVTDVEERLLPVPSIHLQRIIGNILQNSYDALKDKKGRREIKISGKVVKRSYILTIEDNGTGISEHLLPLVREPWFSTKGTDHMGLGLSSVQELVTMHKGEMLLESRPQHFTRTTLKMPL